MLLNASVNHFVGNFQQYSHLLKSNFYMSTHIEYHYFK